jgi:hypothetical protein
LVPVALFFLSLAIVGAWQAFETTFNPAVAAIRQHPVAVTGTVVEVVIDGFGGDPALDYTYSVGGQRFHGHDVGSYRTGNVLEKKPGDHVPVEYAAAMPEVSCLAGSDDCPNDIFAPGLAAYLFWALAFLMLLGLGLFFGGRAAIGRFRNRSTRPRTG